MTRLLRCLPTGGVFGVMVGVGGAAAVSQLVALAVSPLLTRLYPVEAFGQFGAFFAFANIAAALCLLGLNDAVIAAPSDDDADALAGAGLRLTLILLLPVILFSWLAIRLGRFGLGGIPEWGAILVGLEYACLAMLAHLQIGLLRATRYSPVARAYLAMGAGRTAGQLGGGLAGVGFAGLIGGEIAGRLVSITVMGWDRRHALARALAIDRSRVVSVVWRYAKFPFFRTPSTVASALAVGAPPLMMLALHGAQEAGYFNLMMTILMGPVALIQRAVGDVFLGHFARRFRSNRHDAMRFFLIFLGGLALLGAASALVLWLLAESAFAPVFGSEWARSGEMARLAAPWIALLIVGAPLSGVLNVTHRPEAKAVFDIVYLALLALAYQGGQAFRLGALDLVAVLSLVSALAYAVLVPLCIGSILRPGAGGGQPG